jgi:hypothetical protein
MVKIAAVFALVVGCSHSSPAASPDAPAAADAASVARCAVGHAEKLAFAQATGCSNDGSVEFCIPDGAPAVRSALAAIAPAITCGPGGGRAGCLASPGLLLCFYPTAVPTECVSTHGAMTDAGWANVCALSSLPEISAIVPTFFE